MCVKLKYTFLFTLNVIFLHTLWYVKWNDIRPSMVTHTLNLCSALTHPKCTHTHSSEHTHTHTVNTHPEQWAADPAAPGEQLGVQCLAQGHLSRGIEGEESAVHSPPTYNSCQTWDSNSQPLDYESDSLTIRPRLPHISHIYSPYICIYILNICVLYNI